MSREFFRFLIRYKYEVIFPIAVLEGPIITLVSGFLVSLGVLSFVPTFLVVFAGDIISDSGYFALGKYGRRFVEKVRFLHISESRLQKVEHHYEEHPKKTIVVSKLSYGVGSLFLVAAGASKMGYKRFLKYIAPANAVRSFAMLIIGYYLGKAVRQSGTYLEYYTIVVIVLLPVIYYIFRKVMEKKNTPMPLLLNPAMELDEE